MIDISTWLDGLTQYIEGRMSQISMIISSLLLKHSIAGYADVRIVASRGAGALTRRLVDELDRCKSVKAFEPQRRSVR